MYSDIHAAFEEYLSSIRPITNENNVEAFRLKEGHSKRVSAEIVGIAASLALSQNEILLAELIGQLHDIGRFEQILRHSTFADVRSIDHGELGVEVLLRTGILAPLPQTERGLVLHAIAQHNRIALLPDHGTSRERLFAQMIRDADKLDIFRIMSEYYHAPKRDLRSGVELELPDSGEITPEIYERVLEGVPVNYAAMRSTADFKAVQMGWVHDIYFSKTLREIRDRNYLKRIRDSLPATEEIDILYKEIDRVMSVRIEILQ